MFFTITFHSSLLKPIRMSFCSTFWFYRFIFITVRVLHSGHFHSFNTWSSYVSLRFLPDLGQCITAEGVKIYLQVHTTRFLSSLSLLYLSIQHLSMSSLREHFDISLKFQYSLPTPDMPFFETYCYKLLNLQSPR